MTAFWGDAAGFHVLLSRPRGKRNTEIGSHGILTLSYFTIKQVYNIKSPSKSQLPEQRLSQPCSRCLSFTAGSELFCLDAPQRSVSAVRLSSQGRGRNAIEAQTTQGESRWKIVGVKAGRTLTYWCANTQQTHGDVQPKTRMSSQPGNRYRCQQIPPL